MSCAKKSALWLVPEIKNSAANISGLRWRKTNFRIEIEVNLGPNDDPSKPRL